MAKRQSVNFPGFAHQNPIPNASRIGNVMMSSVISGVDPGTRNMPPDLAKQVTNLFTHVRTAIASAGGTPDDIIKMTFWMKDPGTGRAALNEEWLKMFPDATSVFGRATMTDATTQPIKIDGYHAHVYYDTETRPRAEQLQETIAATLGVAVRELSNEPRGPHPVPQFRFTFTTA